MATPWRQITAALTELTFSTFCSEYILNYYCSIILIQQKVNCAPDTDTTLILWWAESSKRDLSGSTLIGFDLGMRSRCSCWSELPAVSSGTPWGVHSALHPGTAPHIKQREIAIIATITSDNMNCFVFGSVWWHTPVCTGAMVGRRGNCWSGKSCRESVLGQSPLKPPEESTFPGSPLPGCEHRNMKRAEPV